MTFDVWFWRQKSSNEKWGKCQDSHNGHKPTVYNEFSLISGHFCHHFTRFSLISQSILNRFSCNFAGTTCNYSGDCPEKLVKFWASTSKVISEISGKFAWVFQNLFIKTSMQTSILNRVPCNFAGTIGWYYGDCPVNSVKFERILQKLLMRLVWNLIEYFKSYSFRRQFRRQFSTVFHVILQAPSAGIMPTVL